MKPYVCAVCEEHRDARDNPPTLVDDMGLVCDECNAEPDPDDVSQFDLGEPAYWCPEVDR